jgi:hypothetical protein
LSDPIRRQSRRNREFARVVQSERRGEHIRDDSPPALRRGSGVAGQNLGDHRSIGLPERIPNEQYAARPKDADHFPNRVETPWKVMQKRIGDDGIEGMIRIRKRAGVGPVDANGVLEPRLLNVILRPSKNSGPAINANDFDPGVPRANLDWDPRRSSSHVENAQTRPR